MSEVKFVTLKKAEIEFIDGDRGKNYPTKEELLPIGDCIFLNTSNVRQNGFDFSNLEFISSEKDSLLRKGKLQRNDIVMTTRGTVGNVAIFSDEIVFEKIRINSGMVIIRVDKLVWEPYFVYLFLQSELFKKQTRQVVSGSAQPQLPISVLETISIPKISLEKQRILIEKIVSIDKKISLNNQINDQLETMAKTLYDYWFVQFDFPDKNGKPYKSSGGKMVYNDQLKREIPEGWGVKMLMDLTKIVKENLNPVLQPNKEFKYYSIPSFDQIGTYSIEYGAEIKSSKFIVSETDVLVSKLNPWFNRVIYNTLLEEAISSTEFVVLKTNDKFEKNFLYQVLTSQKFIDYCTQNATGTSNSHKRVNPEMMVSFEFPYRQEIVDDYGNKIDSFRQRIIKNNQQNQELIQLRDWLLPMLMNGQVRVK